MALSRLASYSIPALKRQVCRIIRQRKGIRTRRLDLPTNLHQELGFDTLDLVDVILEVERRYKVSIPDEVPLRTIGDFVSYLAQHLAGRSLFLSA